MGDYRKLNVWRKARLLTTAAYGLTKAFPAEERYGLTAQIRAASTSIMANIAEGCGRNGDREFARFVSIALGSATELESHLIQAQDQGFLEPEIAAKACQRTAEIRRMLAALCRRLQQG
jgi:four helix bundle protein